MIRTPDQKLRVFVSSTLRELADERKAVKSAIEQLRMTPVMFELGARAHPPRPLYRAYLDQSEVFVGIYWQSYGWVAPDMRISGLEDEYRLRGNKPSLIYVKEPAPQRDDALADLLVELGNEGGVSYLTFGSAEELAERTADDLALLLAERFSDPDTPQPSEAARTTSAGGVGIPNPMTSMVGRDAELEKVVDSIRAGNRLVSLVGPGGIGKTRLAIEVGRRLADDYPGGAHFIDLTRISDEADVLSEIAGALSVHIEGSSGVEDLISLRLATPTLLVLDNVEHVVDAAPRLHNVLARSPDVSVVATSRVPLRISGERIIRLEPLGLSADRGDVAPAVRLFVERCEAHGVTIPVDGPESDAARAICDRLGGLPLAIELAAARTGLFGIRELEKRLRQSLSALGKGSVDLPERQRTIEATVDWSYRGLNDDQKALFSRLSVFPGGATLDQVESVCAHNLSEDTVDVLSAIVDASLVRVRTDQPGGTRFGQMVVLRDYAQARLIERDEYDSTVRLLVDHYLTVGRDMSGWQSDLGAAAPEVLMVEYPNIRATLRWCLDAGEIERAVDVLFGLWVAWFNGDTVGDAAEWVRRVQDAGMTAGPKLAFLRGFLAFQVGDMENSFDEFSAARASFAEGNDERAAALTGAFLGPMLMETDPEEAFRVLNASDEYFLRMGDALGCYLTSLFLSSAMVAAGDLEGAAERRLEMCRLASGFGDGVLVAWGHCNLALALIAMGRVDEALGHNETAMRTFAARRYVEGTANALGNVAYAALARGESERALRLHGACTGMMERLGVAMWWELAAATQALLAQTRESLGGEEYERLLAEGKELTFDEAVALGQ